ncbi:MAG: Asp-tRNA(Asn)/Glu-tRNA(Gln) amidotransferase subunit GatC [Candidatus Micrarchaeota archaeon]|nr:Asp-tRNA(Asn)/Glu-tRNA(Gln) amidotransferase subunit GatC [Candidatus Micrarchaeota archaeon]
MEDAEFDRLLKICRLRLSSSERTAIKSDVKEILKYFDTIEKVDTGSLKPAYHPVAIEGRLREDRVEPFDHSDLLLKGTKTHRFYVVGPDV